MSEHKSAFHALFMNPEDKVRFDSCVHCTVYTVQAGVTPGVCHGDELLYLFDAELPLAFCDVGAVGLFTKFCHSFLVSL